MFVFKFKIPFRESSWNGGEGHKKVADKSSLLGIIVIKASFAIISYSSLAFKELHGL